VWTYSGVRPLHDDGASAAQAATRDYVLKLDGGGADAPPVLNIYGGKITTYRRLAEAALQKLQPFFAGMGRPWTAEAPLPGGDFPVGGVAALAAEIMSLAPSCPQERAERLAHAYGTRARAILEAARVEADWGASFGSGLTEREVRYLMEHEWARTAEDVLWRRSKLGLRVSAAEAQKLDQWMRAAAAVVPSEAAR
jgi:glycerol-3-phosphate dehydrogenase